MTDNIKSRQFASLKSDFQTLSENVIQQLSFFEGLLRTRFKQVVYEEMISNEININLFENKIRLDFVNSMLLFAPRAIELRKLITYQDTTNHLEAIGNLLMDGVTLLKTIGLNSPDFDYFKVTLIKMFSLTKGMVGDAIFSFCYEDPLVANKVISEDDILNQLHREVLENITLIFQDLPLSVQELKNITCISNLSYIFEQIGDIAANIAEASVYLIEGKYIRNQFSEINNA